MKKLITLFIAFLYLAVSSGLAVEIHLCMGKVADISLLPSDSHKCGECGMPKGANECCKDELKFVKLQDSHKLINSDYQLDIPVSFTNDDHFLATRNSISPVSFNDYSNHSPPTYSSPLYILNGVLRI